MNRVCSNCGIEKSLDSFNKNKESKDGYAKWCRECVNDYRKKFRKRDNESHKKYLENNPEKSKMYNDRFYERHTEQLIERSKKFYADHRKDEVFMERKRQLNREWEKTEVGKAYKRLFDIEYRKRIKEDATLLERRKARMEARKLVYNNQITGKCQFCGSTENVEKHHPDYRKPLEIIELCKRCHTKEHELEKEFHVMENLQKKAA